jgi:hypothetical protein
MQCVMVCLRSGLKRMEEHREIDSKIEIQKAQARWRLRFLWSLRFAIEFL